MIRIPQRIQDVRPYKAGKPISELAREQKLDRIIKLASNENPLGPSPKALEAIRAQTANINRYVDPAAAELVETIADKYSIQPEHIVCGHGTDSLLADIIVAFSEPNEELLTCLGTFIGIYVSTNKQGRKLKTIPLNNYAFDLKKLLKAVTDQTRIIYLANPNNPTGSMFTSSEFESFMEQVPDDVLVLLDEAYEAYALNEPGYPVGVDYWYDNLLVTRTLSKAYGLGGLRIGYTVGPRYLIDALKKMRLPFEPHALAQVAAIAALSDDEFLVRTAEENRNSLLKMKTKFDELGIKQVKTSANFIMILMPSEEFAGCFYENCLKRGLIVRHVKPFGIPNGIRINSGTEDETTIALEIIEQVYGEMIGQKRYQQST